MVRWQNPLSGEAMKEWKAFSVPSKSGGTIAALFAKAVTGPGKATIVLGHPMGKAAKGYFLKHGYSDLLRRNGYHVVVFDMNGFGESSQGDFSYFEDIVAAGKKAREFCPALPVGYHGISLGGQMATIAFSDPNHTYDFAIIESAATSLEEFWANFPFAYKSLRLLNFFLPRFKKKVNMLERIREAKKLTSLLYIYSETDVLTPPEMGQRFLEETPVPAELWTVTKAGHANIMRSENKGVYEEKIVAFFNNAVYKSAKNQSGENSICQFVASTLR